MRKVRIFFFFFLCSLTSTSQHLNVSDLTKIYSMKLNDVETFLSHKKFEFKDAKDYASVWIDYNFAFNLDSYGVFAEEFITLSYLPNGDNPFLLEYELPKESWLKLKNSMQSFGFKKTNTGLDSDNNLATEYQNIKVKFIFKSSKSAENNGQIIYNLFLKEND